MKLLSWLSRITGNSHSSVEESDEILVSTSDPFSEPIEIEIKDVFDLHTIQPREVKLVVEEYLYQAHQRGFLSVRIIHGKGIGVQRAMVRSILATTSFVIDYYDAPPEAGGTGATIVRLR